MLQSKPNTLLTLQYPIWNTRAPLILLNPESILLGAQTFFERHAHVLFNGILIKAATVLRAWNIYDIITAERPAPL